MPHMDSTPDNRLESREEEDEFEIRMGGERLMTFMVQYNLAPALAPETCKIFCICT